MDNIHVRRRKAFFDWATQQSASQLALMLIHLLSRRAIKMIIEDNNIPVKTH